MQKEIKNSRFSASVESLGAELRSLEDLISGTQYIWQANPQWWAGSAPVLFPIIGMLKDGRYRLDGAEYRLPKHGFARGSEFELIEEKDDCLVYCLQPTAETRIMYPFEFCLRQEFRLIDNGIRVTSIVSNKGLIPMYFAIGAHPAINLDHTYTVIEDYCVKLEKAEKLERYTADTGLIAENPELLQEKSDTIAITADIFKRDALIFKDLKSRKFSIVNERTGYKVTVDTGGSPWLGIWAKPGAPFVCIEPWFSCPDTASTDGDFKKKPGIMELDAGEEFSSYYEISV